MPDIVESSQITGVFLVHLQSFADDRGRLAEIFRKEWFPERSWNNIQSNRSESAPGVLRGLHYHHHQIDYWHVVRGRIRAGLVDLRIDSPTKGNSQLIDIGESDYLGLFIPTGVAHGFLSLTESTLMYIVDNYYNGSDEYGVAWDDPTIGLTWGTSQPKISQRDANNPRLKYINGSDLPT